MSSFACGVLSVSLDGVVGLRAPDGADEAAVHIVATLLQGPRRDQRVSAPLSLGADVRFPPEAVRARGAGRARRTVGANLAYRSVLRRCLNLTTCSRTRGCSWTCTLFPVAGTSLSEADRPLWWARSRQS